MQIKNLSIAAKIYSFSALFASVMLAIQFWQLVNINQSKQLVVQQNQSLSIQTKALKSQELALVEQQTSLTTRTQIQEMAALFSQLRYRLYDQTLANSSESGEYANTLYNQLMENLTKLAQEDDSFEEIAQTIEEYFEQMRTVLDAFSQQDMNSVSETLELAKENGHMVDSLIMDLLVEADEVVEENSAQLNSAKQRLSSAGEKLLVNAMNVEHNNQTLYTLSLGILLFIFLLSIAFSLILRATLVPALRTMKQAIEEIDSKSDLSKRIKLNGQDELGETANAFNNMLEQFQHIVEQVFNATHQVNESIDKAEQMMIENKGSVERQSQETENVSSAINQMADSINTVVNHTQHALNVANEAQGFSSQGTTVIAETIAEINTLQSTINDVSETVEKVYNASKNIDGVLDVIRSISDQTNLLALNAAIEAARAGDAGRGFAVVADEVRALAQRTTDSTEQIQNQIETLQKDTGAAVEGMTLSRQQSDNGVSKTQLAGKALENINQAMEQINRSNSEIAQAAESQAFVAAKISEKVVEINNIAHTTAQNVAQTSTAITQLTGQTHQLEEQVMQFKV